METKVIRTKKKFSFNAEQFVREGVGIIRKDIQYGIENGVDLNDKQFMPLQASTIARKARPHIIQHPGSGATPAPKALTSVQFNSMKRKAGTLTMTTKSGVKKIQRQQQRYISKTPSKPLVDSANLQFNQSTSFSNNVGIITVGSTRKEAAQALQVDGIRGKRWLFFGISVRAVAQLRKLLEQRWKGAFSITRG